MFKSLSMKVMALRFITLKRPLLVIIGVSVLAGACLAETASLKSPDGRIEFTLQAEKADLSYRVTWNGEPVIDKSPLGIQPVEGGPLGPGLSIRKKNIKKVDESYEPVWGKEKTIRDHYNLLTVNLGKKGVKEGVNLFVRAYDEGIAFRYGVDVVSGTDTLLIANELTAFQLVQDATAWALFVGGFNSAYESKYTVQPVTQLGQKLIGMPLLLQSQSGLWMAITEANLNNYAGQYISTSAESPLLLNTRLSPAGKDTNLAVRTQVPMATPWRVLLLAEHPGRFIESSILFNCNDPCALEDTSWIQPGKCMWDWWNNRMVSGVDFKGGINTETYLHYADFAAEMGFEYMLIDDGWSKGTILKSIPEVDIPRIMEYCRAKDVKVLLWLSWGRCNEEMAEAFPLYEKWGISGVKIDFMNADHQRMVDFYHRAVKLAAKHHLVVDFHGAYKPTGEGRTWPNWITQEGVLGEESSKWSKDVTPSHNVTLPFTRMVAGPMDYTPGGFDNWHPKDFRERGTAPRVMGTRGHNLAKYVIYDSPIQMCVDYPANYEGQPGQDFLRFVPAIWQQTKVLEGYPGRSIVMARKNNNTWYIGAMMGDVPAKPIHVPLDFLGDGAYRARVWEDGDRANEVPTQLRVFEQSVTKGDTLTLNVISSGGAVARLAPEGNDIDAPKWLRHLVGIQWNPDVEEKDKEAVLVRGRDFPKQIPEILKAEYGTEVSGRELNKGFEDQMLFTFKDKAALERYREHPIHQEFLEFSKPYVKEILVLDWNVPAGTK